MALLSRPLVAALVVMLAACGTARAGDPPWRGWVTARELASRASPECLDILATAEAAIGHFTAAADQEGKAISLLPKTISARTITAGRSPTIETTSPPTA